MNLLELLRFERETKEDVGGEVLKGRRGLYFAEVNGRTFSTRLVLPLWSPSKQMELHSWRCWE